MGTQRHLIMRQTLEITVAREQDAWPLQQELERLLRTRITPLIDRCCTAVSAPDRLHRIARLELDLGTLDALDLDAELVSRVQERLPGALADQIRMLDAELDASGQPTVVASGLELLASFARNGSLPWWADLAREHLVEEAVDRLLDEAPARLLGLLRRLMTDARAVQRLVRQLDDVRLGQLTALSEATQPGFALALFRAMRSARFGPAVAAGHESPRARIELWEIILQVSLGSGARNRSAVFQGVLIGYAARSGPLSREALGDLCRGLASAPSDIGPLAEAMATDLANGREKATEPSRVDAPSPRDQSEAATAMARDDVRPEADPRERDEADALYIGNAGLVILAPVLPAFFERLGLLVDRRFRDADAAQRGVALLQYLASADPAPPEYWLPLNKLLCGLALESVWGIEEPLTGDETQACESLLESVIAQAAILNRMSNDGFRGSFLLRRGVLSADAGAWLLRVERETYDLVLDRCPWSLSWVKLPWMGLPLRVEW